MSRDPAGFVRRWVKSQKRDGELIMGGEGGRMGVGLEVGAEGVWESQTVRESVGLMVGKLRI